MATLMGVSPVLLVADLDRAVDYYRERLGFDCEVFGEPPNFATAVRDEATVLLALSGDSQRLVPQWRIVDKMWNAYIRVDDVDAIYAEVQRGAAIDPRSTRRLTTSASLASQARIAWASSRTPAQAWGYPLSVPIAVLAPQLALSGRSDLLMSRACSPVQPGSDRTAASIGAGRRSAERSVRAPPR